MVTETTVKYITENIDLDVGLMRTILELDGHVLSHEIIAEARKFVEGIIRQLGPEDRKVFEGEEDGL